MGELAYHIGRADQYLLFGMIEPAIECYKDALRAANRAKLRKSAGHIIVALRCCHQALKVQA